MINFDRIAVNLPTIQIEGYEVMTEATIKNISVDFAKGLTLVGVRSGKVKFLKSIPDNDLIESIQKELWFKHSGKYYVSYRCINIMGEKSV